jgi:hypothetical protein
MHAKLITGGGLFDTETTHPITITILGGGLPLPLRRLPQCSQILYCYTGNTNDYAAILCLPSHEQPRPPEAKVLGSITGPLICRTASLLWAVPEQLRTLTASTAHVSAKGA